jgi:RND family efflux transporter MFP subunit
LPGQTFKSAIARTADSIDAHSRTLRVEADVPNTDQALVPGMYVDVNFEIPSGGLVEVPAAALVFRNSGPQVALVDKTHHVHFQSVSIARDNGSSVEINSGVSVGDQIVLNISNQISEGATVQINKPDEDASHAPPKK